MDRVIAWDKTKIEGVAVLPASKSISNRALVLCALAGCPVPENLSDSDDTRVLREALSTSDIGIDSIKLATGIQIIMQSQQAGRFTRLTRSMKYKIFPLINQRFQLFQSDTRQQIDIIVDIRLNWTCRIEKLRYSYPTSAFRCNSLGKIQKFIHFTTGTNRFYPHQ